MSSRILKKIHSRESLRQKIISDLFEIREMINGYFHHLKVRCGDQYCWCMKTEGAGHPHQRIQWKINGKKITRAVPKEDIVLISNLSDNFKKFKSLKQELVKLEKEVRKFLDDYEMSLIKKSQKLRPYLMVEKGVTTKIQEKTSEKTKKRKERKSHN